VSNVAKSRRKQPTAARAASTTAPAASGQASPAAAPTADPPRPTPDPRAAERIARQKERAAARRRQEQMRQLRAIAIGAVVVVAVGAFIIWLVNRPQLTPAGQSVPIAGWNHIDPPAKATNYNSVPPTSGDHYGQPANAGVYPQPIPDETQVHNLEHGQIMVQYTCSDCPELAEQLKQFNQRYPKWVLVAPYPDPRVGARIVLTSWGRIDKFDEFDEQRITTFIESNKNKGRENVIME
jgi:hypothetical protein